MHSRGLSDSESVTRTLAIIQLNHAVDNPSFPRWTLGNLPQTPRTLIRRVGDEIKKDASKDSL